MLVVSTSVLLFFIRSTSSPQPGPSSAGPSSAGPSTADDSLDPAAKERKEELLKIAPKVPYNMDLSHWGEEIETPLLVR